MSFDGILLHHIIRELKTQLEDGRIQKIYQLSTNDLLFQLHTNNGKQELILSNSPSYSRIHLTTKEYEKPTKPPQFTMFLRKHLQGGFLTEINQHITDRVVDFTIKTRNEIGDVVYKHLIHEVMNKHGNIIITDNDYTILEAIKHVMPFDGNQRTVFPGATYSFPETTKVNPFEKENYTKFDQDNTLITKKNLLDHFMGFSPLLCNEIIHRFESSQDSLSKLALSLINTTHPVIITGDKELVYFTPLKTRDGNVKEIDTLNQAVDHFYYDRDTINILKQHAKYLHTFIKNTTKRLRNKLDKLAYNLQQTESMEDIKIKGELLKANLHNMKKGQNHITVLNYYTNKDMMIPLDPKKTPVQNVEAYFKRYKKKKKSIPHIKRQIKKAKYELYYFDTLQDQLEHATLQDIEEIREELIEHKYLKPKKQKNKRNKKPNYTTYKDELGIQILVGKNNIQNEYITHKIARHNDVWFHVQNAPGSHVIVRHPLPLEENTIRTAAQLASYYSKLRLSNSVPVDYTEVRNIKKIPGKLGSFVSYKNQKTIYIDPDEEFIYSLQSK